MPTACTDVRTQPRPMAALRFASWGWWPKDARFIACPVRLDDLVVHPQPMYPDKVKAPGCCAPIYEVDIDGHPLPIPVSTAPAASTEEPF
ncbi:MAG TPA: hypothetical protein VF244_11050 [Acidimicrobiales bacterium]